MTLVLSGTDGLSDVDGSAATPAIRGSDTNTGMFFPAADTIAFSEGGVESMRLDSNGNVGIGTSSPGAKLDVSGGVRVSANQEFSSSAYVYSYAGGSAGQVRVGHYLDGTNNVLQMITGQAERARIDSSGNLLVGTTSVAGASGFTVFPSYGGAGFYAAALWNKSATNSTAAEFRHNGTAIGNIFSTATSTAYNTSSDYRLKENIQPMTGALAKVQALKPCTYKWKADGSDGEGFIAHELAEVVPGCVTGEKDAVNEDGSIKPQSIDTSFLVATLTAAIQELKSEVDALKAQLGAQA